MLDSRPYKKINRIPGNGRIIFPLSMSRLHMGQSPQEIYAQITYFWDLLEEKSVDFICVYTNGLYFNADGPALDIRLKTNAQMMTHKSALQNKIKANFSLIQKSTHFTTYDEIILNSNCFLALYQKLKHLFEVDNVFQKLVLMSTHQNNHTQSNIHFVLEETAFTIILREKLAVLPHLLSEKESAWQLICYAGEPLLPDVYYYLKNKPNKKLENNWFSTLSRHAMFNAHKGLLYDYNHFVPAKYLSDKEKGSIFNSENTRSVEHELKAVY